MSTEVVEPDLYQFEASRWSFTDDAVRADYVVAVEELRETMRATGTIQVHARLLGQPSAAEVRAITRIIASKMAR